MCRLSYTLIAGAMVLATLLKESSCFTLHRFDQGNDDPRVFSSDTQHHPATATGSDDEFGASQSQDRLFKRSALSPPAHHQLTAAEWELLLKQMIAQHNVDSSGEENVDGSRALLLADDEGRVGVFNNQRLDKSDELLDDDDQRWDEEKDAELLKKLFGVTWESVKDMKFDHTSTEDLIEDWLRKQNKTQEQQQEHLSS